MKNNIIEDIIVAFICVVILGFFYLGWCVIGEIMTGAK